MDLKEALSAVRRVPEKEAADNRSEAESSSRAGTLESAIAEIA
jgi:hypothetical protein